jgi:hypothetical protein
MNCQKQRFFAFGVAKNWEVLTCNNARDGGRWDGRYLCLNFVNVLMKDVTLCVRHDPLCASCLLGGQKSSRVYLCG